MAESYNGYCVKCKDKRDFDGEVKVSEKGTRMAQGTGPVCGTKMNRILGKACASRTDRRRRPLGGAAVVVSGTGLWTAPAACAAALPPCRGE